MSDSNQIAARGKVSSIILKDIDISINELKLMDDLPFAGDLSNAEIIYLEFFGVRVEFAESFNFQRGTGASHRGKIPRNSACSKCKNSF